MQINDPCVGCGAMTGMQSWADGEVEILETVKLQCECVTFTTRCDVGLIRFMLK